MTTWSARRRTLAIVVLFAALSVVFTWPLLRHLDYWGIQDWDFNYFKQAAAARAMRHYRQFPLWNPWYFGGTAMLGEPESRIVYPTFPLYFVMDAVRALKLEVVVHYVIGLSGAFMLARHHKVSRCGAVTVAVIYMFSGMFAQSLASGMAMFIVAAFIPWVFWAYLRSLEHAEWAVVAAAALALMFLGGAVHFAALTGLWLALYALAQVAVRPSLWKRVAPTVIAIGMLAGAFSAVKLLPTLQFMAKYPRAAPEMGGFSVEAFVQGLLGRQQDVTASIAGQNPSGREFWTGSCWGPDETGMYIGIAGLVLVLAGIVVRARSKQARSASLPLLVAMALAMWLSFGFRAPPLWSLVHRLPLFDAMRTPERLRFVFFLAVALFAGFAVDTMRSVLERRWGSRAATALTLIVAAALFVDYCWVNAPALRFGAAIEPQEVTPSATFQQITRLPPYCAPGRWLDLMPSSDIPRTCSWFSLYPTMLSNRGGLSSDAAIGLEHHAAAIDAERSSYAGEVSVEGGSGRAHYLRWSPDRLVVLARLDQPGWVVVNQNYDDGWQTNTGTIESRMGRLAVHVSAAGEHLIELSYRPASVVIGLGLTVGSAIAAFAAFALLRMRRRREGTP